MKQVPITGSKPQMKLKAAPGNQGNQRVTQAEAQIKQPPAPFGNPQGTLKPVGAKMTRGTSGAKSKKSKFYGA